MSEEMAKAILEAAIREHRCAEFMDCLFEGGSATVDPQGRLVLASGDVIAQLMGRG